MISVALSGCGFRLAASDPLPNTLHQAQLVGTGDVAAVVFRRLQAEYAGLRLVEQKNTLAANAPVIQIENERFGRRNLGLNANGTASGYEMSLSVKVTVQRANRASTGRTLVLHRSLLIDAENPMSTQALIKEAEADLLQEMVLRVRRLIALQDG